MENFGSSRDPMIRLIGELTQGKELTRQLESQMESLLCSNEQLKQLLQRLLSVWDRAISVVRSSSESDGDRLPRSLSGSPRSEGSEGQATKDQPESQSMFKKRKTLPKTTRRVRADPASLGLEGPLDDGFGWRKYGQKDIHGAKHPRSYYRCTHRHTHGCPALKHIQRADDDPAAFDITYRGRHTCTENLAARTSTTAAAAAAAAELQILSLQQQQQEVPDHPILQGNAEDELGLPGNRRDHLTVRTQGIDMDVVLMRFPSPSPSFSFSSTPVGYDSSPTTPLQDTTFEGGLTSPAFASPRASYDPTGFPSPLSQLAGGCDQALSSAMALDLTATLYTEASSSTTDIFMLENLPSDPDFPFDSSFYPPDKFH